WSSGGPAAYALSLQKEKTVTGSFVAMSVFNPKQLPPLSNARGHSYFLYHSPDDKTCPFWRAKQAKDQLARQGARVKLTTYAGGHGWRGDVYGDIRAGIKWLEGAVDAPAAPMTEEPLASTAILLSDGFETGRVAPDGWDRGARVPGVRYLWDKREAFEGKASLCLRKTAKKFLPIAAWNRTLPLPHTGASSALRVSVQVKAVKVSRAVVDLLFLDASGEWIKHEWAVYVGARGSDPPADHGWREYVGTVDVPDGTEAIRVALQIYGPGNVWFDALKINYVEPQTP
ncbi:unnamed protein product, partial [marine sediment metagenome]